MYYFTPITNRTCFVNETYKLSCQEPKFKVWGHAESLVDAITAAELLAKEAVKHKIKKKAIVLMHGTKDGSMLRPLVAEFKFNLDFNEGKYYALIKSANGARQELSVESSETTRQHLAIWLSENQEKNNG